MRLPARPALAAALALVVVAALAGYGVYLGTTREVPAPGGTLHEGVIVDGPFSLLPPFAATQNARDISSLLYRGLTRPGPDGRPQPDLAASWQADPKATTFTFHLRPKLSWSDGTPLTSADALFSLTVLQADELRGTAVGDAWQGVTATAPDAQTVVYTLPSPSSAFPTLASIGLLPAKKLSGRPAAQLRDTTDAPTSGPFRLQRVDRDVIHLVRNSHAGTKPYLDGLDIRLMTSETDALAALQSGSIDLLTGASMSDAAGLRGSSRFRVVAPWTFSYAQVLFNQKTAALAELKVRRAVAQAIDRKGMIASLLSGYGRLDGTPVPPTISWAADPNPGLGFDPRAAARSLDAAGWARHGTATRTKSGQALSLRLAAPDLPLYRSLAAGIKADLGAVGIAVQPSFVSPDRVLGDVLQAHNFDLALSLIDNGPDPDIFVFWHSSEEQAGGFNFSGMPADPFLDKDLEDGRFKTDLAARKTAYLDAQKILRTGQPAVWLFNPSVPELVSSRIKGFSLPPAAAPGQRYEDVAGWYINSRRVGKG